MLRNLIGRNEPCEAPHVKRATRYELRSSQCAVHVVDCTTHDHAWTLIVLEFEHFGEPMCFEFNAANLDAVSDMLNAARAMLRMK